MDVVDFDAWNSHNARAEEPARSEWDVGAEFGPIEDPDDPNGWFVGHVTTLSGTEPQQIRSLVGYKFPDDHLRE